MGFPAKKYDFRAWTDGRIHVLSRGKHYDTPERTFAKTAWMWADRHGYRVSAYCYRTARCIALQFRPAPGQVPA